MIAICPVQEGDGWVSDAPPSLKPVCTRSSRMVLYVLLPTIGNEHGSSRNE